MRRFYFLIQFLIILGTIIFSTSGNADETVVLSKGQTIYVPAYSHIYVGNRETPLLLTVTISIRNVDPKHSVKVTTVDYYETQGKLLKKFLASSLILKPLESIRYIIPQNDKAGGSGANFIVEWNSDRLVNPPIVETVMIGQQGMSFTSRGQALGKTE